MASKPESSFIKRIHRKLNSDVYKQAMGLTATNGTPDYYYELSYGALWVEYKWYDKEPYEINLCDTGRKPNLSRLQQIWLRRAYKNNQTVYVIAGYPGGCIILPKLTWDIAIAGNTLEKYKATEQRWVNELNI